MKEKKKTNQQLIDDYDYLANAASVHDCTGLIPGAPVNDAQRDLTLGKRTVHRKLAAMVVRKLIVKNGVHQSREGKRQQECQSIDTALSYDRKQ